MEAVVLDNGKQRTSKDDHREDEDANPVIEMANSDMFIIHQLKTVRRTPNSAQIILWRYPFVSR